MPYDQVVYSAVVAKCLVRLSRAATESHAMHAQGHKDWLFGAAWVTERHLISCSRDKSVKLWQINVDGPAVCSTPLHTSLLHKVRSCCQPAGLRLGKQSCIWVQLPCQQAVARIARVV